jgi:arginyl-tRNA synthetase
MYTAATEMLDLGRYTRAPFPGVVAARVTAVQQHPKEQNWQIATVKTVDGTVQVICAGTGFVADDLVAYAPPQTRVKGKLVEVVEKGGVVSTGMICSEAEIGLSDNNSQIALLPDGSSLGTEVAEIFRIPNVLAENVSVLEHVNSLLQRVSAVLQKIEQGDPETIELWKTTKEWSMQELYEVYDWLNCRFSHYFFESQFGESSKELVREFQKTGVFEESDGAVGANLREFNLGFCLLIKRDGTALYATRDLALAQVKFEEYGIDRSIYVVDVGQTLHFQQVFKCLELMGYEQSSKCFHLPFALVVRPDGKMSSRKGNVILFSELVEKLTSKITQEFLEKYRGDWSDDEIEQASTKLSLATIRYGMLNQDNQSMIVFDLDEWTSRAGNTGPYLLYAYARIQSILRDAPAFSVEDAKWDLLAHDSEIALLMHVKGYHELLERAAANYSPHLICSYIYDLSKKFSKMYAECSILKAESDDLRTARLCLAQAVGMNIKHGLSLLGIDTIDRM